MTFIDFFAGVGGFRRGMELAGHKCLGFCEYDKFAVQSYRAMHDTDGEWYAKDIRTVRANDIPRADVWCAGFPCQDVSIAGKCLGFKGKRSSLFFSVTGLIKDLEEKDRPSYLFFENVKNLLSVNGGFDFARVLIELDEIGYDAEWTIINSADVVPQNRQRVFIVGHLRSGRGREVFPVGKSNEKSDCKYGIKVIDSTKPKRGIAPCLNCMGGGGLEPKIAVPVAYGLYTGTSPDFMRQPLEEKSRCLKANKTDAGVMIFQKPHGYNKGGLHSQAPSLTSSSYEHNNLVVMGSSIFSIRKLTPLECWRLQGWEDEYFFRAFFLDKDLASRFIKSYNQHKNTARLMRWAFGHQKMSDSQLYKQAGNGVTVTVIQRIAEKFRLEDQ